MNTNTSVEQKNFGKSSRPRAWVRAHPIVAYVALAYLFSWLYWIPLALGPQTIKPGVGWPSHLPGLLGPAIAAIIVTALAGGRAALTELWQRLTKVRTGLWWLSVVAILLAGAIGLTLAGGVDDPAALTQYNGLSASLSPLLSIALVILINGIGEEMGWRGFLADRLLKRHSLIVTSLLVALVWAPWHTPLFFFVGSFEGFSLGATVGWVIGLTAGSFVLTWLYKGSGRSILLVAVWHTAFNFTSATPAATGMVAAFSSTLVMVAAVAIVLLDWRRSRKVSLAASKA
jgi:membrane protease YdiL (CAAX protease family)